MLLTLTISQQAQSFKKDSLISSLPRGNGTVKYNTKNKTYTIYNRLQIPVHKKVKYYGKVGQDPQIIDHENQVFYLDDHLKKVVQQPAFRYGFCGTVPHYEVTISKGDDYFFVKREETFMSRNGEDIETIDSIPLKKVDDLFLGNMSTSLRYNSNYFYEQNIAFRPHRLIYKKGNKYGVWDDSTRTLADSIQLIENMFLFTSNGLMGYIDIHTSGKYKELGAFVGHLARFTLPDGKKGYIDISGNEYLD